MNALPPYDAIYIMTEKFAMNNPEAVNALKKLDGRIDTDTMRSLNYKFDVEKMEPRNIARDFLVQEGLIEA
jgi:osmoprotectant transport system substrate-binding protein